MWWRQQNRNSKSSVRPASMRSQTANVYETESQDTGDSVAAAAIDLWGDGCGRGGERLVDILCAARWRFAGHHDRSGDIFVGGLAGEPSGALDELGGAAAGAWSAGDKHGRDERVAGAAGRVASGYCDDGSGGGDDDGCRDVAQRAHR